MTMLLRNAKESDLNDIYQLAEQRGIGMTSLPFDINILEQRITWSLESFTKVLIKPDHEYYLFVLEDTLTKKAIGTSAIDSCTGFHAPYYSYRISKHTQVCDFLNIRTNFETLNLVNDNQGNSEICTLFLDPKYRHKHNGILLSRSRFLFIANFPERIAENVIAEMRGVSDESGLSPFWEAICKHFFNMPFAEADRLTLATNKQFIADLMPKNPIYINLLSPEARAVIGKTHELTESALHILLREGFKRTPYVDIFDAGPTIEATRDNIRSIKESQVMTIHNILNKVAGKPLLISNTELDFRATVDQVLINNNKQSCTITKNTAQLLQVNCGDKVRIVT